LKTAIEKNIAIKIIQEKSFARKDRNNFKFNFLARRERIKKLILKFKSS